MASESHKKVRTVCPDCRYTFETTYVDKLTTAKCPECYKIFGIDVNGKVQIATNFHKKYTDVVGFGVDKATGKEVAVDTKGRRVDPKDTRYNPTKDPHGWRATGKKVKGFTKQ